MADEHPTTTDHTSDCPDSRADLYRCGCGWLGERGEPCEGEGTLSEMVVVERVPDYLRASHAAAGGSGQWPHDGSRRAAVLAECGASMTERDEWAEQVYGRGDRRVAGYAERAEDDE